MRKILNLNNCYKIKKMVIKIDMLIYQICKNYLMRKIKLFKIYNKICANLLVRLMNKYMLKRFYCTRAEKE